MYREDFNIMIASHPFGHQITTTKLITAFTATNHWEDRYRQLIQLGKQLPKLPDSLKQQELEITGCENRVWLGHQHLQDGSLHFYGDSESRIIRGLLAILLTVIEGKRPQQLLEEDPRIFFEQLGLHQQLSASRANGLQALVAAVITIATRYQD